MRRLWCSVVGVIRAFLLVGGKGVARAAASPLVMLGTDTLSIAPKQGESTADGFLSILNTGDSDVPISVAFQASSSKAVAVLPEPEPNAVPAGQATRVKVTFTGLKKLTES